MPIPWIARNADTSSPPAAAPEDCDCSTCDSACCASGSSVFTFTYANARRPSGSPSEVAWNSGESASDAPPWSVSMMLSIPVVVLPITSVSPTNA